MKKIYLYSFFLGALFSGIFFFGDAISMNIGAMVVNIAVFFVGEKNLNLWTYSLTVLAVNALVILLFSLIALYYNKLNRKELFWLLISYLVGLLTSFVLFLIAAFIAASRFKGF